ncbi:P-loop NTPase fold protein [Solirubrobacter soli]|uniref:P-loop NTPase fold protein n=1 Tax=Solirubrobacter soli TaxID=363832 RepID=UPI0004223829|nr:P-loop NTPase fold protein [Solirubrobacter soli]
MDALKTTPTVEGVASELGNAGPVPAQRVVDAILSRHTHDYPVRVIEWPAASRVEPVDRWLAEARELLTVPAHPELHGRAVILALALADPVAGREIVRSGLWFGLTEQLPARFVEGLTPLGLQRLETIPLLAAITGVAMGTAQLDARINDLAFNPSGQLILVGTDRGWTLVTRSYRRQVRRRDTPSPVFRVGWTADGRELLVGRSGIIEIDALRPPPRGRVSQAWLDGRSQTVVGDGSVRVVDPAGAVLGEIGGTATDVALSVDGATIATRDDSRIALWDVASGRQYWSVPCDGAAPLAISPDGTRIAAAGARGTLLDAATGERVQELAERVDHVVFSDDGTRLAMGCADGSVYVANPETGMAIAQLAVTSPVTALRYAQDGEQLVAGTEGGLLVAWAGDFQPLVRRELTAYSADDTRVAEDRTQRLPIDPDVDALAALLAARTVDPPLSVGLFGDWGSGKTFFMRRLRGRVAELAGDARDSGQMQKDVAWHKRIVQIEFNAWHYAEGNLWASLVEHILGNLRLSEDEDEDVVERRRNAVERQIVTQQQVVADARDDVAQTLRDVNEERAALEEELAELDATDPLREVAAPAVRKAVADAVLTPVAGDTFAQLEAALDDTRAVLDRGTEVLTPLVRAPDHKRRLAWLALALLAAPVVAWVVARFAPEIDGLAGVVAGLGGLAAWLQRQAAWTQARLDDVQQAKEQLEAPLREARERHEEAIRAKQLAYDAAERKAQEEQAKLVALEHELKVTTPSRMLARLIADRVESDDYRRHLGVLALVRKDFEAMSDYLRIGAGEIEAYETLEEEEADDDARVGRIVLYIDDLDRCEPDQVVAVLQAVHLLLAFPLFTVVVGVDVRWVERALRLHHKHLLDPEGGAEPRDYLEKIFQIPFWLEPLDADASRAMLRGMLGATARRGTAPAAPDVAAATDGPASTPARTGTIGADTSQGNGATPTTGERPAPLRPPPPAPRDLQPPGLEITDDELAAMDELAWLLNRSPRALKRFLNTYRLIKVRAEDPAEFMREAEPIAPYKATLLLLAHATGRPRTAGALLDAILRDDPGEVTSPWPVQMPSLKPYAEEVVRFTFHWHQSMYS